MVSLKETLFPWKPMLIKTVDPSELLPYLMQEGIFDTSPAADELKEQLQQAELPRKTLWEKLLNYIFSQSGQGLLCSFLQALKYAGYEYQEQWIRNRSELPSGDEVLDTHADFRRLLELFAVELCNKIRPNDLLPHLCEKELLQDSHIDMILKSKTHNQKVLGILHYITLSGNADWPAQFCDALLEAGKNFEPYTELAKLILPKICDKNGRDAVNDLTSANRETSSNISDRGSTHGSAHIPNDALPKDCFKRATQVDPRVLLVYSFDFKKHQEAIVKLAQFLKVVCHLNVILDVEEPNSSSNNYLWMVLEIEKADKVLIIHSEGSFKRYDCHKRNVELKDRKPSPHKKIFDSFVTHFISRYANKPNWEETGNKFINARFDYTDETSVIADFNRAGSLYVLMDDIEDLLAKLYDTNINNDDFTLNCSDCNNYEYGHQVKEAVTDAKQHIRQNPRWLDEKYQKCSVNNIAIRQKVSGDGVEIGSREKNTRRVFRDPISTGRKLLDAETSRTANAWFVRRPVVIRPATGGPLEGASGPGVICRPRTLRGTDSPSGSSCRTAVGAMSLPTAPIGRPENYNEFRSLDLKASLNVGIATCSYQSAHSCCCKYMGRTTSSSEIDTDSLYASAEGAAASNTFIPERGCEAGLQNSGHQFRHSGRQKAPQRTGNQFVIAPKSRTTDSDYFYETSAGATASTEDEVGLHSGRYKSPDNMRSQLFMAPRHRQPDSLSSHESAVGAASSANMFFADRCHEVSLQRGNLARNGGMAASPNYPNPHFCYPPEYFTTDDDDTDTNELEVAEKINSINSSEEQ